MTGVLVKSNNMKNSRPWKKNHIANIISISLDAKFRSDKKGSSKLTFLLILFGYHIVKSSWKYPLQAQIFEFEAVPWASSVTM